MDAPLDPMDRPGQKTLDLISGVPAPKTPLRMKYEAETRVFRQQHGDLEQIRQKLGFSRRKMCQLLLVDPSAWTRWTKHEAKVPPHVYRSLEWFLALNEKALTQPDLARIMLTRHNLTPSAQNAEGLAALRTEVVDLKTALEKQRQIMWSLITAVILLALTLAFNRLS